MKKLRRIIWALLGALTVAVATFLVVMYLQGIYYGADALTRDGGAAFAAAMMGLFASCAAFIGTGLLIFLVLKPRDPPA